MRVAMVGVHYCEECEPREHRTIGNGIEGKETLRGILDNGVRALEGG